MFVQKHALVRLENLEGWIEVRRCVCDNNITVHWRSGDLYLNTAPITQDKAGDDRVRELARRAVLPEATEELTTKLMQIIASLRLRDA